MMCDECARWMCGLVEKETGKKCDCKCHNRIIEENKTNEVQKK